jgi:hypothetical protein
MDGRHWFAFSESPVIVVVVVAAAAFNHFRTDVV